METEITFTRIKEFCSDMANSMSDNAADRVFTRAIQDALRSLAGVHNWKHLRERATVQLLAPESHTVAINATQGKREFTTESGKGMATKYKTELWDVILAADSTLALRIVEILNDDVKADVGQEWLEADVAAGTYTAYKSRYELPSSPKLIYSSRLVQENLPIDPCSNAEYENYRAINIGSAGSQPNRFTTKGKLLFVWPAPDQAYQLALDYQRHVNVPEATDDDHLVIDWPIELEHLLRSAVQLELLGVLGRKKVNFDPDETLRRFQERLFGNKANDQHARVRPRQMKLRGPGWAPAAICNDPMRGLLSRHVDE